MKKYFLFTESALINRNGTLLEGADITIQKLMKLGIPFLILSEDSRVSRAQICANYEKCGLPCVPQEYIYTSLMAAADEIRQRYPDQNHAMCLGTRSAEALLKAGGFDMDYGKEDWVFVLGWHSGTYQDYCYGLDAAANGARLVCVSDQMYEDYQGHRLIGQGAIVRMLEEASGKKALYYGYPGTVLLKRALIYAGFEKEETVFVGRDLAREIRAASDYGMTSAWITQDMEGNEELLSKIRPGYFLENPGRILD